MSQMGEGQEKPAEQQKPPGRAEEKPAAMAEKEERTWGMLAHILGLVGIIGPLIVWLIKKEESPFVDDQGKEAVNFQLTILIGVAAGILLSMTVILALIGIPLLVVIWVFNIIMVIMAGMKANQGERYRYPICIRFVK